MNRRTGDRIDYLRTASVLSAAALLIALWGQPDLLDALLLYLREDTAQ